MRNVSIDALDCTPRPAVAIGTDYPHGTLLPWHSHRRAQLLYGATGVMQVQTQEGAWVVPPQQAVWIPASKPHQVRMLGVSTRSIYITPEASPRPDTACAVLGITPLTRQLLLDAVDIPAEYDLRGRDGALIKLLMHEIQRASTLPLHVPFPSDEKLAQLCRDFLHRPNVHDTSNLWAKRLHVSDRTFNRRFLQQTGMPFGQWRQRACVVLALSRLAMGDAVTTIALDLGYESPGAFSTMFRKLLGSSPSDYYKATAL